MGRGRTYKQKISIEIDLYIYIYIHIYIYIYPHRRRECVILREWFRASGVEPLNLFSLWGLGLIWGSRPGQP